MVTISSSHCLRFLKLDHSSPRDGENTLGYVNVILAGALSLSQFIVKLLHIVFVENGVLTPLSIKASLRTHQTFCPKMHRAYFGFESSY